MFRKKKNQPEAEDSKEGDGVDRTPIKCTLYTNDGFAAEFSGNWRYVLLASVAWANSQRGIVEDESGEPLFDFTALQDDDNTDYGKN